MSKTALCLVLFLLTGLDFARFPDKYWLTAASVTPKIKAISFWDLPSFFNFLAKSALIAGTLYFAADSHGCIIIISSSQYKKLTALIFNISANGLKHNSTRQQGVTEESDTNFYAVSSNSK